ncbi:MAG: outer membrane lipoprotein carrier protein LolA [Myxococcota bacterium]
MRQGMRLVTLVLGALLAGALHAAPAKQPGVNEIVSGVQKLYDGTRDFSASFEQEYVMAALGRSHKSRGKVAYRRPGKIRFDYVEPAAKTFAVDGGTLWVHQVDDKQVLVDRCFKADGLTASLVFLGGGGRISDQFDVTLGTGDDQHHALVLKPRTPQGMFKSITLWVDKKTLEVHRTDVEDQSGNPNRFFFSDVRRNKGVKDEQVTFTPPKDAAVSPVPGSCATP